MNNRARARVNEANLLVVLTGIPKWIQIILSTPPSSSLSLIHVFSSIYRVKYIQIYIQYAIIYIFIYKIRSCFSSSCSSAQIWNSKQIFWFLFCLICFLFVLLFFSANEIQIRQLESNCLCLIYICVCICMFMLYVGVYFYA